MTPTAPHPLLAASALLVDTFAWADWKQSGQMMVSPSGKRKLSLESFQRLSSRAKKEKPGAPPQKAGPTAPVKSDARARDKAVGAAVREAFPGLRKLGPDFSGQVGDRNVTVQKRPGGNVEIAFYARGGNPFAVADAPQTGSVAFLRGLGTLTKKLAAAGVGIEYEADARHQSLYERAMKGAGLEMVSQSAGTAPGETRYTWKPAGATPKTFKNIYGQDIEELPKPSATPAATTRTPREKPTITLGAALPGYSGPPASLEGLNRQPVKAVQPKGLATPLPDPTPADSAYINAQYTKDQSRFGAKVAETLRMGLATAVGILSGANGLAWGAILGTALGGPLGLALGTAIGGGIGGKIGGWAGRKTDSILGGGGRAAVMARQAARKVVPKAVGLPIAALGTLGGLAQAGAITTTGMALGGPAGGVGGAVLGGSAGLATQQLGFELGDGAAKMARVKLARSKAAKRVAARDNATKLFAEPVANLDPVVLIKARIRALLASQGKPSDIEIDDEPILAALALVAQNEDENQKAESVKQMSDALRVLRVINRSRAR